MTNKSLISSGIEKLEPSGSIATEAATLINSPAELSDEDAKSILLPTFFRLWMFIRLFMLSSGKVKAVAEAKFTFDHQDAPKPDEWARACKGLIHKAEVMGSPIEEVFTWLMTGEAKGRDGEYHKILRARGPSSYTRVNDHRRLLEGQPCQFKKYIMNVDGFLDPETGKRQQGEVPSERSSETVSLPPSLFEGLRHSGRITDHDGLVYRYIAGALIIACGIDIVWMPRADTHEWVPVLRTEYAGGEYRQPFIVILGGKNLALLMAMVEVLRRKHAEAAAERFGTLADVCGDTSFEGLRKLIDAQVMPQLKAINPTKAESAPEPTPAPVPAPTPAPSSGATSTEPKFEKGANFILPKVGDPIHGDLKNRKHTKQTLSYLRKKAEKAGCNVVETPQSDDATESTEQVAAQ